MYLISRPVPSNLAPLLMDGSTVSDFFLQYGPLQPGSQAEWLALVDDSIVESDPGKDKTSFPCGQQGYMFVAKDKATLMRGLTTLVNANVSTLRGTLLVLHSEYRADGLENAGKLMKNGRFGLARTKWSKKQVEKTGAKSQYYLRQIELSRNRLAVRGYFVLAIATEALPNQNNAGTIFTNAKMVDLPRLGTFLNHGRPVKFTARTENNKLGSSAAYLKIMKAEQDYYNEITKI